MKNRCCQKECCLVALLVIVAGLGESLSAQSLRFAAGDGLAKEAASQATDHLADEERLVHLAYLKLAFYNRVANARSARLRARVHRTTDDLRFRLEKVRRGQMAEIYDTVYGQLVTKPTGEIIRVTAGEISEQLPGGATESQAFYPAAWGKAPYSPEDWERATVREVLRVSGRLLLEIRQYVSFEVEVSLGGESRRYRALALVYDGPEPAAEPKVEIIDNIAGIGGLMTNLLYEGRTPAGGNSPAEGVRRGKILGFVSAAERAAGADSPLICDYERRRCCWRPGFKVRGGNLPLCDAAGRPEESRGALLSPVTGQLRAAINHCDPGGGGEAPCRFSRTEKTGEAYGRDSTSHNSGYHEAKISATGFCQTTAACHAECDHDRINFEAEDVGFPASSCHIYFSSYNLLPYNNSYKPSEPPSCTIKASIRWRACTFCWCAPPPLPGINWEVAELWTLPYESTHQCSGN